VNQPTPNQPHDSLAVTVEAESLLPLLSPLVPAVVQLQLL